MTAILKPQEQVLVLGGRGQIGQGVVADLLAHTQAHVVATGRSLTTLANLKRYPQWRVQFMRLDLAARAALQAAIARSKLVIHCAGPFRQRDERVLKACIEQGVNYIDVSDDREFTRQSLALQGAAQKAGITAVVNTGVFPGISNSLVHQGAEQLDALEQIHLSYAVSGSGGAGAAVMQTTFLNLFHAFPVWVNDQWQTVKPYTGRTVVEFPQPFGRTGVYWFDLPEAWTLATHFPAHTVTVKFGSVPDLYNHLSCFVANQLPARLIQNTAFIQAMSRISRSMTAVSDRISGTGVAVNTELIGRKHGKLARYTARFTHSNAALATGQGAGIIAQFLLSGQLHKPGVWTMDQALPTPLFEQAMQKRGNAISQSLVS